jgi:hypothetical protein
MLDGVSAAAIVYYRENTIMKSSPFHIAVEFGCVVQAPSGYLCNKQTCFIYSNLKLVLSEPKHHLL